MSEKTSVFRQVRGGEDRSVPADEKETRMTPGRVWTGLMFLALGLLGILSIGGAIDFDKTVGEWWPLAIVGWSLAEMIAVRRLDLGWSIVGIFGVALLADEQGWGAKGLMWTLLFIYVGVAILIGPAFRRRHAERGITGGTHPK